MAQGDLVLAPFRSSLVRSVVWETSPSFEEAERDIQRTLLSGALTPLQMAVYDFTAEYYGGSVSTMLKTTLPLFPLRKQGDGFTPVIADRRKRTANKPLLVLYTTSSGKYADMLRHVVQRKKTVLCIFPTHAALQSFAALLTKKNITAAVLEHGQSSPQRRAWYSRIRTGDVRVILTTKIGVFAPLPKLDTILLDDEEHPAHKQYDQQPFYDTRTLAGELARRSGAAQIWYTQAPRVETWHALAQKSLQLSRAGRIPSFASPTRVDIRTERRTGNQTLLSEELRARLAEPDALPALLYLNRREHGEAPESRGLETLHFEVRELFPGRKICVIAGSTIPPTAAQIKAADIILATERLWSVVAEDMAMRTVAAVDSDRDRLRSHFRARERTFQSLVRLRNCAQRAGAKFYIQTREPQDILFHALREKNWKYVYKEELETRNAFSYPPFAALTKIRFLHNDRISQKMLLRLRRMLPDGAALTPVFPVQGRLPFAALLKESPKGRRFGSGLAEILPRDWTIDVDPLDLE